LTKDDVMDRPLEIDAFTLVARRGGWRFSH
jgi:hypothetical protein